MAAFLISKGPCWKSFPGELLKMPEVQEGSHVQMSKTISMAMSARWIITCGSSGAGQLARCARDAG